MAYAFGSARDWYDTFAVARELGSIKEIGDGFARQGYHHILADVYLLEGELDRALTLAKEARLNEVSMEEVAKAAKVSHPRGAIELYKRLARRQISRTKREAYRVAAEYLQQVKLLSLELGEGEAWRRYIADLRAEYPRHRALRDELNKAGL